MRTKIRKPKKGEDNFVETRGRKKKPLFEKHEIISFTAPAGTKEMLRVLKEGKINKSQICAKAIKKVFRKYLKENI